MVVGWLRLELRRRWRPLGVLVLLVALASGTVMASLAGARRTDSAIERLESRTDPATTAILANTPNFNWAKIRTLPEVAAYTTIGPTFPIEGVDGVEAEPLLQPAAMSTIERAVIASGRNFDPTRSDEAVVPPGFLSIYHLHINDRIVVDLPTPAQLRAGVAAGRAPNSFHGLHVPVRIVGVGISRWFGDSVVLSPGFEERYAGSIVGPSTNPDRPFFANALFRLDTGRAGIAQFRADAVRVSGRPDLEVLDLAVWADRPFQQQATFAAQCLLGFAVAAFLAAMFLVGQAVTRYVSAGVTELRTLRAFGATPRQVVSLAVAGPIGAAMLGGVVGVGAAVLGSQWFPIGVASTAEPSPGISVDWVVLGPGLAIAVGLVVTGALATAKRAVRVADREAVARRSVVATLAERGDLPTPVAIGTRFALETGRGRTTVPVRPALLGAVIGVLGVVAAFTFSHGVSDAADHPEQFGQTFQLSGDVGNDGHDFGPTPQLLAALQASPMVAGVDDARVGVATGSSSNGSVSLYTYSGGTKPLDVVLTSGRLPQAATEVALAPQSIKSLHTSVGSRVLLSGSDGTHQFTVTGAALVPNGYHNNYADGGWVTDAGYASLFTSYKFHSVYVTLTPSARTPDAAATLIKALKARDPRLGHYQLQPPEELAAVTGLRAVRHLPILLGGFLALLAIGAVGHALATAVRRRSHDLAVLRTLGMTKRQCRWVVVVQGTVLALIGLVFGVPIGLAVGRTIWRALADHTPFQYVTPVAAWTLILIGPCALLVANLLAAWPGHRAARLRIAQVLRAE